MQLFGSKSDKLMGRGITAVELKSIEDLIQQRCDRDRVEFPPKVENELNRRIKEAGKTTTKAKLGFNGAGLEDKYVIYMIEALATSPVIVKLELRDNNITDKGIGYIVRLLRGQVKLIKTMAADKRINANYLSHVDVGDPSDVISVRSVEEVKRFCDVLAYCNAASVVRRQYVAFGAPSEMSADHLQNLWKEVIGRSLSAQTAQEYVDALSSSGARRSISYDQAEMLILRDMMDSGTVPSLSDSQLDMFMTPAQIQLFKTTLESPRIVRSDSQSSTGSNSGGSSLFSFTQKSNPQGSGSGGSPLMKGLSMRFTRKKSHSDLDPSQGSTMQESGPVSPGKDKSSATATSSTSDTGRGVDDKETSGVSELLNRPDDTSVDHRAESVAGVKSSAAAEEFDIDGLFHLIADNKKSATLSDFMNGIQNHPVIASLFGLPSQLKGEDGSRSRCLRLFSDMDEDCTGSISLDNFSVYVRDNGLTINSSLKKSPSPAVKEVVEEDESDEKSDEDLDDEEEVDVSGDENGATHESPERQPNPTSTTGASSIADVSSSEVGSVVESRNRRLDEKDSLVVSESDSEGSDSDDEDNEASSPMNKDNGDNHSSRQRDVIRTASLEEFSLSDRSPLPTADSPVVRTPPISSPTPPLSAKSGSSRGVSFQANSSMSSYSPSLQKASPAPSRSKPTRASRSPYSQASLSSASPSSISRSGYSMGGYNDDSYLDDEEEKGSDEASSQVQSSYSRGKLMVTGRGLEDIDLPQDVESMLYTSTGRSNKRKQKGPHTVKKLIFSHNNISTLVTAQLHLFRNLLFLDLSFNSISSIEGEFPPNLEVLRLKKNEIKEISGVLLCTNLQSLDLSHNKIRKIDGLPSQLDRLDLSFNAISGDMNLRMLALCPKMTALAIQGNPVMSGACKGRMISLLPCLQEFNHVVLPRARKNPNEPSHMPLPHESFIWPDSPVKKSRQGRSQSPSKPTKRRNLAAMKRQQDEGDLRRHQEAEKLRESREKKEAQIAELFKKMHDMKVRKKKTLRNKQHKAEEEKPPNIDELSSRLYSWRPMHIKQREEAQRKLEAEKQEMAAAAKVEEAKLKELRKQQRREKYKQRKLLYSLSAGHGGPSGVAIVSEEEFTAWTLLMQSKLSLAYELICSLFDDVQTLHSAYSTGETIEGPKPQDLLDRYIGHLDRLYYDLQYLRPPEGAFSEMMADEVSGWEGDVKQCCAVMQGLKEIIFLLSPVDTDGFTAKQLLYPIGNVLSSLQMSDDGVPYDLVFWGGGVARCQPMVEYAREQAQAYKAMQTSSVSVKQRSGTATGGKEEGKEPGTMSTSVHGVPPFSPIRPKGNGSGGGIVDYTLDDDGGDHRLSMSDFDISRVGTAVKPKPESVNSVANASIALNDADEKSVASATSTTSKTLTAQAVQDRMESIKARMLLKAGVAVEKELVPQPPADVTTSVSACSNIPVPAQSNGLTNTSETPDTELVVDVVTATMNPPAKESAEVDDVPNDETENDSKSVHSYHSGCSEENHATGGIDKEEDPVSDDKIGGDQYDSSAPAAGESHLQLLGDISNDLSITSFGGNLLRDVSFISVEEEGDDNDDDEGAVSQKASVSSQHQQAQEKQDTDVVKPIEAVQMQQAPHMPGSRPVHAIPSRPVLLDIMDEVDGREADESYLLSPMRSLPASTNTSPRDPQVSIPPTGSIAPPRGPVNSMYAPSSTTADSAGERPPRPSAANNVASDMAKDEISAADIFTRMGNLKQRIMGTGSGGAISAASSVASVSVNPPPPIVSIDTGRGEDMLKREISDLSDSDVSDLSDSKAESGQTQGSSALERLKAKVAMNKKTAK